MDIAGAAGNFDPAQPLDGRSLLPAATGRAKPDGVVYGEFMAEGTAQPIFMIRRGPYKYVGSQGDPPMLFDLSKDPRELHNLAGGTATAAIEARFAEELAGKWDAEAIRRRVLDSQRGRRVVHEALMMGRIAPWDFQPRSRRREGILPELWSSRLRARAAHPGRWTAPAATELAGPVAALPKMVAGRQLDIPVLADSLDPSADLTIQLAGAR